MEGLGGLGRTQDKRGPDLSAPNPRFMVGCAGSDTCEAAWLVFWLSHLTFKALAFGYFTALIVNESRVTQAIFPGILQPLIYNFPMRQTLMVTPLGLAPSLGLCHLPAQFHG
jgi:hypothetical protein